MDVEAGINLTGKIISFAHFLNLIPCRWNSKTKRIEKIQTRKEKYRWLELVTLSCVVRGSYLLSTILKWKSINLSKAADFLRLIGAAICFITLVFQLHSLWKRDQLVRMMNTFHLHQIAFSRQFGRRRRKKKIRSKSEEVTLLITLMVLLGVILLCPLYLLFPNCHLLAGLLPLELLQIKSNSLSWILWRMMLACVQIPLALLVMSSVCFPTLLAVPMALFDYEIANELSNANTGKRLTTLKFCARENGIQHIKQYTILENQYRECMLNSLYPFAIFILITLFVISFTSSIKFVLPLSIHCLLLVFELVILTYLYCYIYVIALTTINLNAYLKDMRRDCNTKEIKTILNSIKPPVFHIGHFSKVTMQTCTATAQVIVEWTVNLLLM